MLSNFSLLTDNQKTSWSMELWEQARNVSFISQFLGKDANSMIQHITELKRSEKGSRAVITLLNDMEGDGIAGDRTLEGNEEALRSSEQVIRIDQLRNANRHEGKMADQKSIIDFRRESRDKLAYWLADRVDQLGFLTMAGLSYNVRNSGGLRTGSDMSFLEFAADVTPPTTKRFGRWNGTTSQMEWGVGTSAVTTTDTPAWAMFIALKAYAKDNYIRGIREKGGQETYHAFLSPQAMSRLKMETNYLLNLRHAQPRGDGNNLFTGSVVKIDDVYLHEFRHVPNTRLAPSGSKYGATGTVEGCQVLFCGAQAMAMADLGAPEWVEKGFDFENQQAISTGKAFGFLKPKFYTQYSGGTVEDFGVISVYLAQ